MAEYECYLLSTPLTEYTTAATTATTIATTTATNAATTTATTTATTAPTTAVTNETVHSEGNTETAAREEKRLAMCAALAGAATQFSGIESSHGYGATLAIPGLPTDKSHSFAGHSNIAIEVKHADEIEFSAHVSKLPKAQESVSGDHAVLLVLARLENLVSVCRST